MFSEVGQMVKYHRKRQNLSRMALAERAGVGKTVIYDVEMGKATVKFETIVKIFQALDIQMVFRTPTIDVSFKAALEEAV